MLQVFPREKRAVIRADVLISAATISSAKRFAQIEVVTDFPLEEAGFEPSVPRQPPAPGQRGAAMPRGAGRGVQDPARAKRYIACSHHDGRLDRRAVVVRLDIALF